MPRFPRDLGKTGLVQRLMALIFVVIRIALVSVVIHVGLVLVGVMVACISIVVHFLLAIAIIGTWSHSFPSFPRHHNKRK